MDYRFKDENASLKTGLNPDVQRKDLVKNPEVLVLFPNLRVSLSHSCILSTYFMHQHCVRHTARSLSCSLSPWGAHFT